MKKRSILVICEHFSFFCDAEIGRKGNFSRWPFYDLGVYVTISTKDASLYAL